MLAELTGLFPAVATVEMRAAQVATALVMVAEAAAAAGVLAADVEVVITKVVVVQAGQQYQARL